MALDELDQRLLRLLQEDARRSDRELARLAKTTGPTVAARIARMREAGIIRGYTVRLDPEAFQGEGLDVDVGAARVQCHTCHGWTEAPMWATIGGARHPFCCKTCRETFRQRHDTLSKGL